MAKGMAASLLFDLSRPASFCFTQARRLAAILAVGIDRRDRGIG